MPAKLIEQACRDCESCGSRVRRVYLIPAKVAMVHDDPEFIQRVTEALRFAGHEVATFLDPKAALDALDSAQHIDVLVTRARFPTGKLNGITLAQNARVNRPGIRLLFTARPEFDEHAAGLGEFMAAPVSVPDVVAAVQRLLR